MATLANLVKNIDPPIELTQAQYNALSQFQKENGFYFITDGSGVFQTAATTPAQDSSGNDSNVQAELNKRLEISNIVNNGVTTAGGYALDARYGKTLADSISSNKGKGRYYSISGSLDDSATWETLYTAIINDVSVNTTAVSFNANINGVIYAGMADIASAAYGSIVLFYYGDLIYHATRNNSATWRIMRTGSATYNRTQISIAASNITLNAWTTFNSSLLTSGYLHIFTTRLNFAGSTNTRYVARMTVSPQAEASGGTSAGSYSIHLVGGQVGNGTTVNACQYYFTGTPTTAVTGSVEHYAFPI